MAFVHPLINERTLFSKLKIIFPHDERDIQINVKKEVNIKYPRSGTYMEFDLWIPKLNLCFEFQDSYHYETTWYNQYTTDFIQHKDYTKKAMAQQFGLTLIIVPCWWDGDVASLSASIAFQRGDIFPNFSSLPISLNPPSGYFQFRDIPSVGELMYASFPVDENKFQSSITDNQWWMGEKYDGVRYCWNSDLQKIYSRNGKELSVLPQLFKSLPENLFLDGELWFGRGQYIFTYMIFKEALGNHWDLLRFVSFDVPHISYHNIPFEKRYEDLIHLNSNQPLIS